MDLVGIANFVEEEAKQFGWEKSELREALTGSVYLELIRDKKEWVVIRVANHKQFYHRWLTTYSLSPFGYDFDGIIELLSKPFGEVGDVL
jgi:hypothetical protein